MLRSKIALHWASPVLFLLLLQEEMHQRINGIAIPDNSHTMRISPRTDYFDIWGKKIRHVDDGKSGKKFVLTGCTSEDSITKAIKDHQVIDVPSMQVIDYMEEAYQKAETTCKEEGF